MASLKFGRILVAIADPSVGTNKAIRRASELARKTGAKIELFNAIPSTISSGIGHAEAEHFTRLAAEQNRRRLEQTADRLRRDKLIVTANVQTGYPVHEAILRQIRLTKADLVVIEARKHNVFARLLLTQTDFELIRQCPVPLWIVKRSAALRRPLILAALDPFHANDKPSALDGEIVEVARAVAAAVRGAVHAAHIHRPLLTYAPSPMGPTAHIANPVQEKTYEVAVRRRFYESLSRYGIARKKAHLVCGDPPIKLPIVVRSLRAGLVVMGAMSRTGLKRIFIGNTAEQVLDSIHCDVLIVRPRKPKSTRRLS